MLVIKNKDEEKEKTPHLALTHEAQGGPANGRKVSLIMKGLEEMDSDQKAALSMILKSQNPTEDIEKASYQSLYRALDQAVRDLDRTRDRWGWAYVRDFDDSYVIYSNDNGVFATTYTDEDNEITLGEEQISVNEMILWEDDDGKIIVTQSDSISSNVGNLVEKSFESAKPDDEKLKEIFKSKYMEGKKMDELKAENQSLKDEVEKANKLLADANALVESLKAKLQEKEEAEAVRKAALRTDILKSVVAETEVEALQKSLEALDDEAFETVIKTMKSAKEAAEEASGMFKQVSKTKTPEGSDKQSAMEVLTGLVKEKAQ